jgi:hypothetical protein
MTASRFHLLAMIPTIQLQCPIDWNDLAGDSRSRFCEVCNKSIYNFSVLSEEERQQVIATGGSSLCISYLAENGQAVDLHEEAIPSRRTALALAAAVALGACSQPASIVMVAGTIGSTPENRKKMEQRAKLIEERKKQAEATKP